MFFLNRANIDGDVMNRLEKTTEKVMDKIGKRSKTAL
jgi:hypothetical protein